MNTIKQLKNNEFKIQSSKKIFSFNPIIKIPEKIFIPDEFISDLDLRISIYKRISVITTEEEKNVLIVELLDRFGKFPNELNNLFKLIEIKLLCFKYNIEQIEFGKKGILITYYKNKPSNSEKLLKNIAIQQKNTLVAFNLL